MPHTDVAGFSPGTSVQRTPGSERQPAEVTQTRTTQTPPSRLLPHPGFGKASQGLLRRGDLVLTTPSTGHECAPASGLLDNQAAGDSVLGSDHLNMSLGAKTFHVRVKQRQG